MIVWNSYKTSLFLSFKKCPLNFTCGNVKNGGIEFPLAKTAATTVTKLPFSTEVTHPTCLKPFQATTQSGV